MADTNYIKPGEVPADFWTQALFYHKVTGADPYLLAAIAEHETDFGTLGAGREGYTLGYGVFSDWLKNPIYKGLDNQLMFAGKQINSYFGDKPVTAASLQGFMQDSWKPGDKEWAAKVYKYYAGYDKEPGLSNYNPTVLSSAADALQGTPVGDAIDKAKGLPGQIAYGVVLLLVVGALVFSFYQSVKGGK